MLCFRYCGNLALNHQQSEQSEVLDDQKKKERANCAQSFVLQYRYCELVVFVSGFSYHCYFFSYMTRPYTLMHDRIVMGMME